MLLVHWLVLLERRLVFWVLAGKQEILQYEADEEAYYIDCNANPGPLTITIGGQGYPIDSTNYIVSVREF